MTIWLTVGAVATPVRCFLSTGPIAAGVARLLLMLLKWVLRLRLSLDNLVVNGAAVELGRPAILVAKEESLVLLLSLIIVQVVVERLPVAGRQVVATAAAARGRRLLRLLYFRRFLLRLLRLLLQVLLFDEPVHELQ